MSSNSSIEWTEATWNPVVGCTRASAGCDNCYAVDMTYRLEKMGQAKYAGLTVLNPRGDRHFNGVVRTVDEALEIPLSWKDPRRVFVNSMSDLFHRDVPQGFINRVFGVMEHAAQQHTYQVLTKRAEGMAEYIKWRWGQGRIPAHNIWLGVSVESQQYVDRIDAIRDMPAQVRFLSLEPLLGPIECDLSGIHWVVVGGESGGGARMLNVRWVRDIIAQCRAAGVTCFVKQLGALPFDHSNPRAKIDRKNDMKSRLFLRDRKGGDPLEWDEDLRVREMPGKFSRGGR